MRLKNVCRAWFRSDGGQDYDKTFERLQEL